MITTPNPWIVRARPNPQAKARLFCFTYAGGGTAFFNTWAAKLPASIELCPIRAPGRESRLRERPFTSIPELVAQLVNFLPDYLDKPALFYGHSMGAMVSFETARQLRQLNLPAPRALFVSGCRAPQLTDRSAPIHHLPDNELIDGIRKLNGTPEYVLQNKELLDLLLPLLRADFEAIETYQYTAEPPLSSPIYAFSGDRDEKATPQDVSEWATQTTGSFQHHQLAGDHFFLHEDAFMKAFSAEIKTLSNAI